MVPKMLWILSLKMSTRDKQKLSSCQQTWLHLSLTKEDTDSSISASDHSTMYWLKRRWFQYSQNSNTPPTSTCYLGLTRKILKIHRVNPLRARKGRVSEESKIVCTADRKNRKKEYRKKITLTAAAGNDLKLHGEMKNLKT